MRYPILNVPRRPAMQGAMLDAYNAENAKLKETLAKAEEASRADWGRLHPGPVHTPSQFPDKLPTQAPEPLNRDIRDFSSPLNRDIRDFGRPLFPHGFSRERARLPQGVPTGIPSAPRNRIRLPM